MRVTIPVEFEVESADGEELTERQAEDAADIAATEFLAFCTVIGINPGRQKVEVHLDGVGKCLVRIPNGGDHE